MDGLLDIKGMADYLGVPKSWVASKVSAREIPFTFIGKHVRFAPEHIAEIVAAGFQPALNGPLANTHEAA